MIRPYLSKSMLL